MTASRPFDYRTVENWLNRDLLRDIGGGRRRIIREFDPDPRGLDPRETCLALVLPVVRPNRRGYAVEITAPTWEDLSAAGFGDGLRVRRLLTRGPQTWEKGETLTIYDRLSRTVGEAGNLDVPFPAPPPPAPMPTLANLLRLRDTGEVITALEWERIAYGPEERSADNIFVAWDGRVLDRSEHARGRADGRFYAVHHFGPQACDPRGIPHPYGLPTDPLVLAALGRRAVDVVRRRRASSFDATVPTGTVPYPYPEDSPPEGEMADPGLTPRRRSRPAVAPGSGPPRTAASTRTSGPSPCPPTRLSPGRVCEFDGSGVPSVVVV